MKLYVLAVGSKQPAWIDQGVHEFIKRMPHECRTELLLVDGDKKLKNRSVQERKQAEAKKLLAKVPPYTRILALDERGQSWNTQQWSQKLQSWLPQGEDVCFIIGGPDGLDDSLLQQASAKVSLSAMTLPHGLARILLVEQLYRAWSLLNNHPYHRE